MTTRRTRPSSGSRHAILLALFLIAFASIAARLVWVQVVQAPALTRKATAQRLRDIELPAPARDHLRSRGRAARGQYRGADGVRVTQPDQGQA